MRKTSKEFWAEWHSFWMGWGDGAGLNKAQDIYSHSVIASEPWYYKFGLGIGRLMWLVPVIIWLVI